MNHYRDSVLLCLACKASWESQASGVPDRNLVVHSGCVYGARLVFVSNEHESLANTPFPHPHTHILDAREGEVEGHSPRFRRRLAESDSDDIPNCDANDPSSSF